MTRTIKTTLSHLKSLRQGTFLKRLFFGTVCFLFTQHEQTDWVEPSLVLWSACKKKINLLFATAEGLEIILSCSLSSLLVLSALWFMWLWCGDTAVEWTINIKTLFLSGIRVIPGLVCVYESCFVTGIVSTVKSMGFVRILCFEFHHPSRANNGWLIRQHKLSLLSGCYSGKHYEIYHIPTTFIVHQRVAVDVDVDFLI